MLKDAAISFLGPPTSGKTSLAELLAKHFNLRLLRGRDVIPELVTHYEQDRNLIPDVYFIPALINILQRLTEPPLVLDNIPRTTSQTLTMLEWASSTRKQLLIVHLILTEKQVIDRSKDRQVCSECGSSYHPILKPSPIQGFCPNHASPPPLITKPGDPLQVVIKGYRDHQLNDQPILDTLKKVGAVVQPIDASGTVNQTFALISSILAK